MDTITVYLMADAHLKNSNPRLYMGDICDMYCQDKEILDFLKRLSVDEAQTDGSGRLILSILELIACMYRAAKRGGIETRLQFVNLGADQMIVERLAHKQEKKWLTWLKVGFASLIIFAGSAFTIMTYDQDVDVTGVFAKIYQMTLGEVPAGAGVLEIGYTIGVAAGILLFFNPFTSTKRRKEPSPIEIEMEKYEADIQDTIMKMHERGSS